MPPKRRGRVAKKATPAPVVKMAEPAPVEEMEVGTNNATSKPACETAVKTQQELLDEFSNPNAYRILTILSSRMRQPQLNKTFIKSNVSDDKTTYDLAAHFQEHCVTIMQATDQVNPSIAEIASDHLLQQVYKDYSFIHEHGDIIATVSTDADFYATEKATQIEYLEKRQQTRIESITNKLESGEELEEQIAHTKKINKFHEDIVPYEEITESLEFGYWRPLFLNCQKNGITVDTDYTQIKNGEETEIKGKNYEQYSIQIGNTISYKARAQLTKDGMEAIAYEAESDTFMKARSAAAYSCLVDLLESNTITKVLGIDTLGRVRKNKKVVTPEEVEKRERIKAVRAEKLAKKAENIAKSEAAVAAKQARLAAKAAGGENQGVKKVKTEKVANGPTLARTEKMARKAENIAKAEAAVAAKHAKKAAKQAAHRVHQGLPAEPDAQNAGGQVMMPCIVGPDGKYYMLAPGQGQATNGHAQNNGSGPQTQRPTKKKRNKKKAAQLIEGESAEKIAKMLE